MGAAQGRHEGIAPAPVRTAIVDLVVRMRACSGAAVAAWVAATGLLVSGMVLGWLELMGLGLGICCAAITLSVRSFLAAQGDLIRARYGLEAQAQVSRLR